MVEAVDDQSDGQEIALTVDARQLSCPLPLLKAKQGLHQIAAGECILVLATDAGSVKDFHAFIELSEHTMRSYIDKTTHYQYVIEKGNRD